MSNFTFNSPASVPAAQIVVKDAAQLSGALRSDVMYLIDGLLDIGGNSITVPQGGLYIGGLGFGISHITSSSAALTMFVDDGVYSGDLFIDGVDLSASGVGSSVFNLDNDENGGAVEMTRVNVSDTESMGVLSNYRQGLMLNLAIIRGVDGLECDGTWSGGFRATTCIIVQGGPTATFTGTMFKAGPTLTMGGRFLTDFNAEQIAATGAFCDFAPANILVDSRFQIFGLSVNQASNSFPNMPQSSVKARFSQCDGVANTYVGGRWSIGTEAATVIATQGVAFKIAGTTTYADLQHFTTTGDNAVTYEGTTPVSVKVLVGLSFSGSNNVEARVSVRKWDNSASSYVDLGSSGLFTLNSGGRSEPISTFAFGEIDNLDRIEIWITNETGTSNITALTGGVVSISERSD